MIKESAESEIIVTRNRFKRGRNRALDLLKILLPLSIPWRIIFCSSTGR